MDQLTEKQKYYYLMGETCEWLTNAAVDKAVRSNYPTPAAQLTAVRAGRRIHLVDLIALIQFAKPDFQIPDNLLPADRAAA